MSLAARSYFILALIALLGIVGQWAGAELAPLWRYPAAVWLVAIVYEGLRARLLMSRVQLVAPERAALGRTLSGEIRIGNPSSQTIKIETMPDLPAELTTLRTISHWRINAGEEQGRPLKVLPQRLGECHWQHLYTRTLGKLGLAWWNRRVDLPDTLKVEPDRLQGDERRIGTQQCGDINRNVSGTGHELLGMRDYHPGDPLKAIDWKATARSGKHTVRIFSEEQHLELMLCIDVGRTSGMQAGNLTRLNHYANIAARLAEKAILNGDHIGIVVFADKVLADVAPGRGVAALHQVRKVLERLQTVPRESNPLNAALRVRQLVRQRSLVVMFGEIDETTAARQLLRATQLLTPKHLPLLASTHDREIEKLYTETANDWLDPYHAFAARESRHARQKTNLQLQRLGAHIVETYPEHLDQRLLHYYDELRERHSV